MDEVGEKERGKTLAIHLLLLIFARKWVARAFPLLFCRQYRLCVAGWCWCGNKSGGGERGGRRRGRRKHAAAERKKEEDERERERERVAKLARAEEEEETEWETESIQHRERRIHTSWL